MEKRGLLRNIICFCLTHHKLFDLGRLTITDNYEIEYSPQFLDECGSSKAFRAMKAITAHSLRLPGNKLHWPDRKFLGFHRMQPEKLRNIFGTNFPSGSKSLTKKALRLTECVSGPSLTG